MPYVPDNIMSQWKLTFTERKVVLLLVRGLSNSAIACDLNRSVKTVEAHITAILKKTDSSNRIVLIIKALSLQGSSSNDTRRKPVDAPAMQAANG